jgi:hypothetical protein
MSHYKDQLINATRECITVYSEDHHTKHANILSEKNVE